MGERDSSGRIGILLVGVSCLRSWSNGGGYYETCCFFGGNRTSKKISKVVHSRTFFLLVSAPGLLGLSNLAVQFLGFLRIYSAVAKSITHFPILTELLSSRSRGNWSSQVRSPPRLLLLLLFRSGGRFFWKGQNGRAGVGGKEKGKTWLL